MDKGRKEPTLYYFNSTCSYQCNNIMSIKNLNNYYKSLAGYQKIVLNILQNILPPAQ